MTFEEWLTEKRLHAMNSAAETRKIAADSWGSGYDTGYSDALEHVAVEFPNGGRLCPAGHVLLPQSKAEAEMMNIISERYLWPERFKTAAPQPATVVGAVQDPK